MSPMSDAQCVSEVSPATDAFEVFVKRGELKVPRLIATGQILHFAARVPDTAVEWIPARGTATLSSFTVMWKAYRERQVVPYNVAWVELDEGPRLISTIVVDPAARLTIGMRLYAAFHDGLLVFTPLPVRAEVTKNQTVERGFL